MYAFKVCERKTSGLVEVIIPQPAYHVGPRSARPRNPLGGGGWIRPWSWQDVKKQNLTKENLHLNTPPPPHTHTHTHFHHETWSFLGPSPRSFFGIILSKQKPHVNVGNSQNQTSCILQLQLSRLFPLFSILF